MKMARAKLVKLFCVVFVPFCFFKEFSRFGDTGKSLNETLVPNVYLKVQNISINTTQKPKPLLNATMEDIPNGVIFSLLSSGSLKIFHYCSLESAAKFNPNKQVYAILNSSCSSDIMHHLDSVPNLHFVRMNFHEIIEELPILKQWFPRTKFKEQVKFLQFALGNFARLVLLFQKGGVYIDYDVVVLREMHSDCKNFVMSDQRFTGRAIMGVMAFEKGNQYISEIFNYAPQLSKMANRGGNIQRIMVQVFKDKCRVPEDFNHFFNSPECPPEWGIQAGLEDKCSGPSTIIEFMDTFVRLRKRNYNYQDAVFLHATDLLDFDRGYLVEKHPGSLEVMKEYCPMTYQELSQNSQV